MSWLITALLATVSLAALLPALLLLLAVLDPPRTEEGWRRELASTGGFEHQILSDAYRICHYKKGNRKDGTKKSTRRALENGESISSSGSAPVDQADSSLREYQQKRRDDAHHSAVLRRGSRHRHPESLQSSSRRDAAYTASASSSQPADKQGENRPASHPESSAGEPLQAGSGGRAGSLSDIHESDFWKALVKHGKELGV